MLLSTFSHFNLWHLAANMYVLHSFSSAAVSYLGREHFVAVYLSSGVISSFVSHAYKILLNRHGFSLGAVSFIMLYVINSLKFLIFLIQKNDLSN